MGDLPMSINMKVKTMMGLLLVAVMSVHAVAVTTEETEKKIAEAEARLDSLEEYTMSTTIGKDNVPVSVSGNFYTRLKNFYFTDLMPLFMKDKARTELESALQLVLGVYPNSYVNVWTVINLPFDFSGFFSNNRATNPNDGGYIQMERAPYHHHMDYYSATIWEEMTAGIDIRAGDWGAMLKAGGVLWVNASPFTVWDRDPAPRWLHSYETWEEEYEVSRLYKEKKFRPVKEGGRAFWTNRPFGGVMLDFYKMPLGLKSHFVIGEPRDADVATRDGLRLYAGASGDMEMAGTLDLRGQVYHARVAKDKIASSFEVGVNYLSMIFDPEIVFENSGVFHESNQIWTDSRRYYVNSHVASVDVKGNYGKFDMHIDIASSIDDTVNFGGGDSTLPLLYDSDEFIRLQTSGADVFTKQTALYAKLQTKHWEPITFEMIYVPKDFYSPYAHTTDSRNITWRKQEMYINNGTYRYSHNLMGGNFKFEPVFNRGRFDVIYGLHKQVEPVPDVIVFEHRLNGRKMWEAIHSWSKYNASLPIDQGLDDKSTAPEGRISLKGYDLRRIYAQRGGMRGGTWEVWEEFVPWQNRDQIDNNKPPMHEKWSSSLTFDMAYDIAHWVNFPRNMLLHAYTTLSGVSIEPIPVAYTQKWDDGMVIWSWFLLSEPAIALTNSFHIMGLFGLEIFKAENAWKYSSYDADGNEAVDSKGNPLEYEVAPIDYTQTAIGFGFDWDFAPRAGLHFRYRYATHDDNDSPKNNWKAHIVTAETKAWF
jgi:hypothetical protein